MLDPVSTLFPGQFAHGPACSLPPPNLPRWRLVFLVCFCVYWCKYSFRQGARKEGCQIPFTAATRFPCNPSFHSTCAYSPWLGHDTFTTFYIWGFFLKIKKCSIQACEYRPGRVNALTRKLSITLIKDPVLPYPNLFPVRPFLEDTLT